MRTFSVWGFAESFFNWVDSERHYHVHGMIGFKFDELTAESDLTLLAESIRRVDKAFPWHDDPLPEQEFKSIRRLGRGEVHVHNFHQPVRYVWFVVYPGMDYLRRGQVYSYEKYLNRLAKKLSEEKLRGVLEVRAIIEVAATMSFKTG